MNIQAFTHNENFKYLYNDNFTVIILLCSCVYL